MTKTPIPELETPRLLLRAWRFGDLEALARLNADPVAMRHMGRPPLTLDETRAQIDRMSRHWDAHGFGLWAVEEKATGRFAGRIGVSYHAVWPDNPEVGWFLDPVLWGHGLATEGGAAAVRYAFEVLGAELLVSICTPENAASKRVMEKLGFALLTTRFHEATALELWIHGLRREARPEI